MDRIERRRSAVNVRQALYIRTIAEEKGVTAAAKKLHISQPSLSQMLRQIEEEAGTPLFERGTQVFHPTYAGERYLHAAEVILNTNEDFGERAAGDPWEERGRLRLGISVQRSIQLLPGPAGVYPAVSQVEFRLREAGSAHLEQMVQSGQVDLALASSGAGQSAAGVPADPPGAHRDPHRAGQPSGTGESRPGPAFPVRGHGRPFVTLRSGHSARIVQERLFREQGLHPQGLSGDGHHGGGPTDRGPVQLLYGVRGQLSRPTECFYPLEGYENRRHFYACLRKGSPSPTMWTR